MTVAFVQAKSAAGGSVTLDNPTEPGNCLVVLVSLWGSSGTPTVSGVTLGGAADNFATSGVTESNTVIAATSVAWLDLGCAGGQTAIVVTPAGSATVGTVTVIEFSGVVTSSAVDKSSAGANNSGTSSFSSGATATTTVANEVWVGLATAFNSTSPTVTGPSSPWVDESSVSATAGSLRLTARAGYQIRTTTGAATWSGTQTAGSVYTAIVLALKGATLSPDSGTGSVRLPKLGLSGSGTESAPNTGRAALAPMSASGTGDMLPAGTGTAALPAMSASGADTGALTPFSDLVLHIPGQDAPPSLTPFVSVGGGADPPDGREYTVPSLLDGVFARFGGTYRFLLINESFASPATQRTVIVTVHQHEYTGGPVVSESLDRVLTPASDPTIPNGYVDMGSLTLPIRAIAPQNVTAYFTVSVSSLSGDRWLDCLFLDVQGTTVIINTPDDYSTMFVQQPDANVQIGQVLGSAFDLPAATSVLQYARVSGGPLSLRPGTDNIFMGYSTKGPPDLGLTYWPSWYQDALS